MKKAYLRFCIHFEKTPIPTTSATIAMYATFLARTLNPSSIGSYLNVIKLMHEEQGYSNPLNDWNLKMLKRGINRNLGKPPCQKLPITPQILLSIYSVLDLSLPKIKAFWAASLVAFYCLLRKSTLLPKSLSKSEIVKSLCICDVTVKSDKSEMFVKIRHTKTIQFGQRLLELPVSSVPGSVLCPVSATVSMLASLSGQQVLPSQPLFSYVSNMGQVEVLTHNSFVQLLKYYLELCNIDSRCYSGHSFRRGGCTYAFSLGVSPSVIKLRGDWKSDAYERYVHINESQHKMFAQVMSKSIPNVKSISGV